MIPNQTTLLTRLKRTQTPVLAAVCIALLIMLFNSSANILASHPRTSFIYSLYILLCLLTVSSLRQNLLHPACLFIYVSLLGFGVNIPFFCTNFFPGVTYDDDVMQGVSLIILTSTGAAILGTMMLPRFSATPKILNLHLPHPEVTPYRYLLCAGAIALSGLIRLTFHLGEPGVQPNFPFAGVLQFTFYEGAIIIALWYLSRGLQKGLSHVVCAMALLAGIALIQALLGWRGGIVAMLMAATGIFILQDEHSKNRSPVWLAILAISAVFFINLGNEIRAEKLGGEKEFAKNEQGFLTRVLYRGQGTSRLAEVVKYFGEVTPTNNSFYKELAEKGLSATTFIDREVYGVAKNYSNSIGTSGPGGPFVNFGLIGVFLAYLGLGIFFKLIYNLICASNRDNPTAKIIYSYLILSAVQTQSENFGALQLKGMFAITCLGFLFNFFIQRFFTGQKYNLSVTSNTRSDGLSTVPSSPLFKV